MGARLQLRQRAGSREHHVRRQPGFIEPRFKQKLLAPQAPRQTSTFEQNPATFLLERGDTLNRKHQGLVIEKQRIGTDCIDDPVGIGLLFQLHIHIALSSAVRRTLFGAECLLDAGNLPGHRRMVEAHADAVRDLGVALRSQECEKGPKEGQCPGIPPGAHDGRDFVANG